MILQEVSKDLMLRFDSWLVIQQLQIHAQIWGAPKVDDDVTFFMNSGVTNSDGSESYHVW